jgi:hypothetical protein
MDARLLAARARARWPEARAVLVTLHCAAVALAAIPSMEYTRPWTVDDPHFAAEVHPWASLFGASDEAFARTAERGRRTWIAIHGRVIAPIDVYLDAVGAPQPWDMFSTPNRTSAWFSVDVQPRPGSQLELPVGRGAAANESVRPDDAQAGGSGWQFLSGLPSGSWRRAFFESERTRSFLNRVDHHEDWALAEMLCRYLGRDAFEEDERLARVRCTFTSQPSPTWRAASPAGTGSGPRIDHSFVVERTP